MPKNVFASVNGTGNGLSDASPAPLPKAVGLWQAGDSLLLKAGDTFTDFIMKKGVSGSRIGVFGQGRATLDVHTQDAITLSFSDDVSIAGIDIQDSKRNPHQTGYAYSNGHQAIHLINCNRPNLADLTVQWFTNGIVAERVSGTQAIQGGTARRVKISECYSDPTQARSNAVYLSGQAGWVFDSSEWYLNGWSPYVPQAKPVNQNHDIYNHDDGLSGQYTALHCLFRMSCASGPTADAGAILRYCVLDQCSHDPDGSPFAWVGGSRAVDEVSGCLFLYGDLRIDSNNAQVFGNTFLCKNGNTRPPLQIDLPHVKTYQTDQRAASDIVDIYSNTVVNWSGDPNAYIKIWKAANGRRDNRLITA